MAKKNKFPSDANKSKNASKQVEKAAEEVVVEGQAQELVQIQYEGENHHFLTHVNHLQKGLNQVPKSVYEASKDHFVFKDMVEKGIIKVISGDEAVAEEESSDEGSETEQNDGESEAQ